MFYKIRICIQSKYEHVENLPMSCCDIIAFPQELNTFFQQLLLKQSP